MGDKMHLFLLATVSTFVVLTIWDYVGKNYFPSLPQV